MKRLKIEYLEKTDNRDIVAYRILLGNEILADLHLDKEKIAFQESINKKILIIENFCKEYPDISRKKAIMKLSHIDNSMIPYYKSQFPKGGYRGGGRPVGSKRSDKTTRLNKALTQEEKDYLEKCLQEYRSRFN